MPSNLRSRKGPATPISSDLTASTNITNGIADPILDSTTTAPSTTNYLITYSELPSWLQDNPYIRSYYRPPSNSILKSIQSLSYLHNESINIYTHLIPCTFVPFLSYYLYTQTYLPASLKSPSLSSSTLSWSPSPSSSLDTGDLMVWTCFALGTFSCLGMSATYHCISNVNPHTNKWGNQLDYVGIVSLIWGSFVPTLWYGFWCETRLLRIYLSMISGLALLTTLLSLHPLFRTPRYRPLRALLFISLGLSSLLPIIHGLIRYELDILRPLISLDFVVVQGLFYIGGASIYAFRVPERWAAEEEEGGKLGRKKEKTKSRWLRPGRFDLVGSSHQIFHVCVVVAVGVHGYGVWRAMVWRHGSVEGARGCEF